MFLLYYLYKEHKIKGINVSIMKEIKNKIEHNEGILREIRNRIMKEIWSIIPTSLPIGSNTKFFKIATEGVDTYLNSYTVYKLYGDVVFIVILAFFR